MMCLILVPHFSLAILLTLKVRAQHVSYITSAFTECFPVATGTLPDDSARATNPTTTLISEPVGPLNPLNPPLPQMDSDGPEGRRPPGFVSYSMPPCAVCDCPTCTTASVFSTMLPDLGSKGPIERLYIVTEIYVGMSSLPYFPTPTPIPYGFTKAVETCTDCAPQPVTRTIVVPKTDRPSRYDMTESTGALASCQHSVLSPESGAQSTATSSEVAAAVGTTLITSKEGGPEITEGGQDSGAAHGGASTRGPSTATPTGIQISAAGSSWSEWSLSYGVVISAFWGMFLFQ